MLAPSKAFARKMDPRSNRPGNRSRARRINSFVISYLNMTRAQNGHLIRLHWSRPYGNKESGRERENKVGREVTTRILYILGTFTIRISPGGCCHVPLGHVPGVRPKGLRASSRPPASLIRSNLSLLFFSSTTPSALSSFSLAERSLQGRDPAGEKNGEDRRMWEPGRLGCSRVKGRERVQVTLRTLHSMSTLISRPLFVSRATWSARYISPFLWLGAGRS